MHFPVPAGRLQYDSMGDPREGHRHRGQDIPAPIGSPIYAAVRGTVIATLRDTSRPCGYGLVLEDGDRTWWTYCHMRALPARADGSPFVRGQVVEEGEEIGEVGSTGSSTGPHLHIQAITRRNHGNPINLFRPLRAALAGVGDFEIRDLIFGSERPDLAEPRAPSRAPSSDSAAGIGALIGAGLLIWAVSSMGGK